MKLFLNVNKPDADFLIDQYKNTMINYNKSNYGEQ